MFLKWDFWLKIEKFESLAIHNFLRTSGKDTSGFSPDIRQGHIRSLLLSLYAIFDDIIPQSQFQDAIGIIGSAITLPKQRTMLAQFIFFYN